MGVVSSDQPIVVIAQGWPCWLSAVLAFDLPLVAIFMPWQYRGIFSEMEKGDICKDLEDLNRMDRWPADWDQHSILASGTNLFLPMLVAKLKPHQGLFIYSTNVVFAGTRTRDIARLYIKWDEDRLREYGSHSAHGSCCC